MEHDQSSQGGNSLKRKEREVGTEGKTEEEGGREGTQSNSIYIQNPAFFLAIYFIYLFVTYLS